MPADVHTRARPWILMICAVFGFVIIVVSIILLIANSLGHIRYSETGFSKFDLLGILKFESPLSLSVFGILLIIISLIFYKEPKEKPPTAHFEVTQRIRDGNSKRELPDVGFNITSIDSANPIKAKTVLKIFLGNKLIEDFSKRKDYYGGTKEWRLNPKNKSYGHFQMPVEAVNSKEQLKVAVMVELTDAENNKKYPLLPQEFIYLRKENEWYLEP